MNKCIRMGITAFKFVIWEGKSAVLRSQITFYGMMEHYIINLVGNLKNNCIQKCKYLFSAITQTEFSETQLFLQTSLYV